MTAGVIPHVAYPTLHNAGCRSIFMAKGCMAVPLGHLLDDTKLFSFKGSGFKAYPGTSKVDGLFYDCGTLE